jgi:hypothetical protein
MYVTSQSFQIQIFQKCIDSSSLSKPILRAVNATPVKNVFNTEVQQEKNDSISSTVEH